MDPASDEHLVHALVRLATTVDSEVDEARFLRELIAECVALLPIDAAAVLVGDDTGRLAPATASSEAAHAAVLLEASCEQGPSLWAFAKREPVATADLTQPDSRWPDLVQQAARTGYRSWHAVPLTCDDQVPGVLVLLRAHPGPLAPQDADAARALADVGCAGLVNLRIAGRRRETVDRMQRALDNRILIEQAKGVLAERHNLDVAEAFHRLRDHAGRHGIPLGQAARDLLAGLDATPGEQPGAGPGHP